MTWRDHAACRGLTALFFPDKGQSNERARAVCRGCPVRAQCLEFALDDPECIDHGIWGGTIARERWAMKRHRPHLVVVRDTP